MADISRECFTGLTTDGQLYEILQAVEAGTGDYVLKTGDTMTGKLNLPASTLSSAGINIGVGNIPTSPVAGDLFATNNRIYFQESPTTQKIIAYTNSANNFNNVQTIDANQSVTLVRITQRGTGEAFRVEDDTTPDATAFVISNTGRVGIGTAPDATVALSVDTTGIKFGDNTIQTTAATSGVTSVTATAPIQSTGGTTPVISTTQSGAASDGYLSATDWNTFNDKTYCLTLGHSSTTLAAGGTNAYFSNIFDLAPVGTYDRRQFNVHRNGVIVAASLSFYNGGGTTPTGHSGATMSLWDVTTNVSVATLVSYNVDGVATLNSSTYLATGLNIPIVAGTLYNIYLQAGTFTANPTSVRQTINLFIR